MLSLKSFYIITLHIHHICIILICKKKNSSHVNKMLQIFSMLIAVEVEDFKWYSFSLYSKSMLTTIKKRIWSINKCSSSSYKKPSVSRNPRSTTKTSSFSTQLLMSSMLYFMKCFRILASFFLSKKGPTTDK